MSLIFVIFCFLVFYYLFRQFRLYFQLKSCGLKPQFDIFGIKAIEWLERSDLHEIIIEKNEELNAKTFSMLKGSTPVVVTSDVEIIHLISTKHYDCFHSRIPEVFSDDPVLSHNIHLFDARGERWKRLRTLTSFSLSNLKLKLLFPTIDKCVNDFIFYINSLSNDINDPICIDNCHRLFQNHTSFVLVQCAYGYHEKNHSSNNFLGNFNKAFGSLSDKQLSLPAKIAYFFPGMTPWLKKLVRANKNRQAFLNYLYSLIYYFNLDRVSDNKKNSNYSLLDHFSKHNDNNLYFKLNEKANGQIDMKKVKVEKVISSEEIAATCKFISVAGFDTTSNTLTLLFHLLAKHQDIQKSLFDNEIQCFESEINFDSISSMIFLQNCIYETLRLFPHASPLQHRSCTEDCNVGKLKFRKNFRIILNPWGPHRDHKIWGNDSDCFRPSRFSNLNDEQRRAFMPFGVGPRQCVGMRFALLEMKLTAFRLLKNYSVHLNSGVLFENSEKIKMTVRDTGTIWPAEKINLKFIKRFKNTVNKCSLGIFT